ncbi:MAG: peroxide stress protein YaaA, partial [Acidobacteriota bacterium]
IQPYRLEMGLKFPVARKKNLYEYWGSRITDEINAAVEASGSTTVVNLASNEYFKAVQPEGLSVPLVSPTFREVKDGDLKMISFSAKRARGRLTRYIIDHRLTSPEQLTEFKEDRYRLRKSESTDDRPLFARKFVPVGG